MAAPLHTVVETPEFLVRCKRLLDDRERRRLVDWLAAHPTAGDLMVGTGGARLPVFILSAFAKDAQANLTMNERNQLRAMLGALAQEYRKGGTRHVEGR